MIVAETRRLALCPMWEAEASMGPRLDSRGNDPLILMLSPDPYSLQWGRDLIVAETYWGYSHGELRRQLQWGRDLIVAETPDNAGELRNNVKLQWGRDLIVAETAANSRAG